MSVLLAACGSGSGSSTSSRSSVTARAKVTTAAGVTPVADPVAVAIRNYTFAPATIAVAPGAKVKFTNHDQTAHTATGHGGAFDTGTLQPGRSATVTLRKPGTYTYYCQFHAFMHATITVK